MRLALVTTYPPAECGIGNYSDQLVQALADHALVIDTRVIAEQAPQATNDEPGIVRSWHRKSEWARDILAAIEAQAPQVVHFQHEESIFPQDKALLGLMKTLRERGIKTAVTLHTVHDNRRGRTFHKALAEVCDRVVAHQRTGMADVLATHGMTAEQIVVIPHGTPTMDLPDRATARETLGLPADVPIALFFGFIHYRKRLHVALAAFERVVRKIPEARFVIAGRLRRSHPLDHVYNTALHRQMKPLIARGDVIYRRGFVPPALKPSFYAAADVIVLPHHQSYGSASGVLHEAIAAGQPIIATRGKKFAEAVEAVAESLPQAFPPAGDREAWERAFELLLQSPAERARASALLSSLAHETSWARSAEAHAAMYTSLTR